ncbi:MAG: hypothetical protein H8E35_03710 [Ardenticatenia bacterium]|nr:hypothetical protein [Ardenticatenia bacterium]
MAKVNSTRVAAIKANFEHSDVITEANLADLIDAIAEAAQAHQHVSTGGDGTGTGDAGAVVNLQSGTAAAKPGSPYAGDVYLETDTSKLFICFSAGSWTEVISDAGLPEVGAGDNLCVSSDGEKTTTSTEYVKVKEIKIYRPGAYRIEFALGIIGAGLTAYGRIYRNGNPVGTERSATDTSFVTFSEDIANWEEGDLIQLYYHHTGGTGSEGAKVCNFRVYYDAGPLDGYVTLA